MNMPTPELTLNDLAGMKAEEVQELPIEELVRLRDIADEKARQFKSSLDWINGSIRKKYSDEETHLREVTGKRTGSVTIADGEYRIRIDTPKRVKWDQNKLALIYAEITEGGDDPDQYIDCKYSVSETAYNSWPDFVRKPFEPARTLEAGRATVKVTRGEQK